MDLADIRRKAQAARQFDHAIGVAGFTLRVPTKLESSIAWSQSVAQSRQGGGEHHLRWHRELLTLAVVGWSGVMVRDVLPTCEVAEALVLEPGAAELLFDAQPAWEEQLLTALLEHLAKRSAVEDTAEKN